MAAARDPKTLTNNDLVMSYFTLDRTHPMDDRIAAAAAAGYAGIGLFIGEYQRLKREGLADGWLNEQLAQHSMAIAEIEVVCSWTPGPPTDERLASFEATAWEMADRFGCRYLQAIGPHGLPTDDVRAAGDAYGALCDRAADHGLVVGLEFLPFTDVYDARDALRIVEQANRDNGGICVDIWHHARGANDVDLIRVIPGEKVTGIQMNDGTRTPALGDYKDDCLRYRRPPGSADFDAVAFVRILLDLGVTVPWSLEVCDERVWGQTGEAAKGHATACADGMRAVLAEARQR